MSLTFFPITALLLLLSGVGSPVHAAGYMETISALRKQFLGPVATPRPTAAVGKQIQGSHSAWRAAFACTADREIPVSARVRSPKGPGRAWERKQYRTRFGFAEGAYLAVGPPPTSA